MKLEQGRGQFFLSVDSFQGVQNGIAPLELSLILEIEKLCRHLTTTETLGEADEN